MSVVVFFTPAHAAPAASAHASVIPLIALVPIIVTPDKLLDGGPRRECGPAVLFAKQRPRALTKTGSAVTDFRNAEIEISGSLLVDSAGEKTTIDGEQMAGHERG